MSLRTETRGRVLVQKGGIPVAAIIAVDDLKRLQRGERERAARFKVIAEGWEAFRYVDLGDVDAEVARAVAEARAGLRVERESAPTRRPAASSPPGNSSFSRS